MRLHSGIMFASSTAENSEGQQDGSCDEEDPSKVSSCPMFCYQISRLPFEEAEGNRSLSSLVEIACWASDKADAHCERDRASEPE